MRGHRGESQFRFQDCHQKFQGVLDGRVGIGKAIDRLKERMMSAGPNKTREVLLEEQEGVDARRRVTFVLGRTLQTCRRIVTDLGRRECT